MKEKNEHYKYKDCGPNISDNRVICWTNWGTLPVVHLEEHEFQYYTETLRVSLIRGDVDNELGGYESFPHCGEWWFCNVYVDHGDGTGHHDLGYARAAESYWEIWNTVLIDREVYLPLLGENWKAGHSLW